MPPAPSQVSKLTAIATKEDPEKLYQLIEIIGTGSYGEVFKVKKQLIQRKQNPRR